MNRLQQLADAYADLQRAKIKFDKIARELIPVGCQVQIDKGRGQNLKLRRVSGWARHRETEPVVLNEATGNSELLAIEEVVNIVLDGVPAVPYTEKTGVGTRWRRLPEWGEDIKRQHGQYPHGHGPTQN